MQIYCPEHWFRKPGIDYGAPAISMSAIMPQVGRRMAVGFRSRDILHAGDEKTLLWTPPITEMNGWSEQPSEIAQSYLVGARVIEVATSRDLQPNLSHLYQHQLDILSCEPLLPTLRALHDDAADRSLASVAPGHTNAPMDTLLWEQIRWCGTAVVEGLIYLAGSVGESYLEIMIEEADGEFFELLDGYASTIDMIYNLGRRKLDQHEQKTIKHAIHKAWRLADTFPAYLIA